MTDDEAIQENAGLIYAATMKYAMPTPTLDMDDCLQLARETFLRCRRSYRASKGSFSSFYYAALRRCLDRTRNELGLAVHYPAYIDHPPLGISLDAPLFPDDPDERTPKDRIIARTPPVDETAHLHIAADDIMRALRKWLKPADLEMFLLRFGLSCSPPASTAAIASIRGTTRQAVEIRLDHLLRRMRNNPEIRAISREFCRPDIKPRSATA